MNYQKTISKKLQITLALFQWCLFSCVSNSFIKPQIGENEISGVQKDGIIESIAQNSKASPASFRLASDSTIKSTDGDFDFRQAFLFKSPDRLRIESFPLNTGIALNLLVSKDGNAKYIDAEEEVIHEGSAREDFFGRYLKVPLSERDFRYLLIARIPAELLHPEKLKVYYTKGSPFYDVVYNNFQFYWKVDKETFLTNEMQIRDIFNGKLVVGANYFEFSESPEGRFPNKMSIDIPSQGMKLDLNFRKAVFNLDLNDTLFEIQ